MVNSKLAPVSIYGVKIISFIKDIRRALISDQMRHHDIIDNWIISLYVNAIKIYTLDS